MVLINDFKLTLNNLLRNLRLKLFTSILKHYFKALKYNALGIFTTF